MPVGIKTANRAFSGGSDENSGLHNISTAMNGGVSLNQYTSESLIGPIFAYTEALVNLGCHPSWSRAHKLGEDELTILPILNADFRYLPYTSIAGFRYSGHPDHLTESLAM